MPDRSERPGTNVGDGEREEKPRRAGPFTSILKLSAGDFVAKTLNFAAFIFLARVLGVASYGVLEFALSILTYFLLIADGGLELWATREAARGTGMRELVARVVPLRMLLAVGGFAALLALLPALPGYTYLRLVLLLFGLTLFAQAVDLKWVFMGRERMARVAGGLVLAQIVFAAAVFALVRNPTHLIWVPAFRVAGDLAAATFFGARYIRQHGNVRLAPGLRTAWDVLAPSFTMGASRTLALVNYNFDSVLIGLMLGAAAVGWYGAAYKPITAILAMPVTYFLGLFPALSRTHAESTEQFKQVVRRSLRITAFFAAPIGFGAYFLAAPVVDLLYGAAYRNSVPALQILAWSAGLVILRGTYRQALNAAGRQRLDLLCAASATVVNLGLNILLIPRYGIVGAAAATVTSETVWLGMASYYFSRSVAALGFVTVLLRPVAAAIAMAVYFQLTSGMSWPLQAITGGLLYVVTLALLYPRSWSVARTSLGRFL